MRFWAWGSSAVCWWPSEVPEISEAGIKPLSWASGPTEKKREKKKKTLMSLPCPQHIMLDLAFFCSPCMFDLVACAGMVMLKWLPINAQWTLWRTLSMKTVYSLSSEPNILLTLYQFTVTTSLRVTELYSHFQTRILKLSDMVAHGPGPHT